VKRTEKPVAVEVECSVVGREQALERLLVATASRLEQRRLIG